MFIWTFNANKGENTKQTKLPVCLWTFLDFQYRWFLVHLIPTHHLADHGRSQVSRRGWKERDEQKKKEKTPEAWDGKEEEGDDEVSRDYVDPQVDDEGREEGERVWGLQIHG